MSLRILRVSWLATLTCLSSKAWPPAHQTGLQDFCDFLLHCFDSAPSENNGVGFVSIELNKKGSSIMLELPRQPQDGGAKDGGFGMSLGLSQSMIGVERMLVGRIACSQSLAIARAACGDLVCRRTVTTSLAAAGVSDDFQGDHCCLSRVERKSKPIATQLATLVLRTLPLPGAPIGHHRLIASYPYRNGSTLGEVFARIRRPFTSRGLAGKR